jgi:hypothetical protein
MKRRRPMKYPKKKEYRRYRQHQKIQKHGLRYCIKTRNIFIPYTKPDESYSKFTKILTKEFDYAVQQTLE